jgi:hypothetical protein
MQSMWNIIHKVDIYVLQKKIEMEYTMTTWAKV